MANQPLLTFGIPTCDRPVELERLLLGVVPQLAKHKDVVEVLVKDDSKENSSEDLARQILNDAQINYRYIRGLKEGIDPANIFLATNARGKFLWWCGDDDELLPGAIDKVIDILTNNPDTAFLFVNPIVEGFEFPSVRIAGDKIFKDADELLVEVNTAITLLSTGIFARQPGLKGLSVANKYSGTHFASQPFLWEAIVSGGPLYFIAGPYVLNHPTSLTKEGLFYDGVKTFGVAYFKLLNDDFRPYFRKESIRKFLRGNFGRIWRGLVLDWIRRDIPAPRNRLWELRMYWNYLEYWLACCVMLLPKIVVKFCLRQYKKIFPSHYGSK